MKKILAFLPKIGIGILVFLMSMMILLMAYILFAPNSWPKPFYLVYSSTANQEADPDAPASEPPARASTNSSGESTTAYEPTELPPSKPIEIRAGNGIMLDTGTKIVNLVDPTGRKYLRVGIVLEFAPTDMAYYTMTGEEKTLYLEKFNEELKAKTPVINDAIITLLASQTFESVYTAEGKEALRNQILNTINSLLPEYRVIFVYFTEFVVQ